MSKLNIRHTTNANFPSPLKSIDRYEHNATFYPELTQIDGTLSYKGNSWWPFIVSVDCTHLETMTTIFALRLVWPQHSST